MRKLKIWLSVGMLGLALPKIGHTQGSLIWSRTFSSAGGDPHIYSQANFWLDYYQNTNSAPGHFDPLFDQISFGTNDVGHTFTIASTADDPDFSAVANELANGIDQSMAFFIGNSSNKVGDISSDTESQLFAGVGTGPDLIGYQIQSFGLHVDSLSIQSPGSDPGHTGNWTDFSGQVTLSIYGIQVPEPSSAAVLLLGGGFFFYLRKRRRT
jgi:hypothetical protein